MTTKILLVEDDKVDQMAFRNFVMKEGLDYDYQIVGSIDEANSIREVQDFDLIILDYRLSDGTAFDLIQTFNSIPCVLLTGAGGEEIAVTALKNGAYDYIVKDHERRYLKILPITVSNVLKQHRNEVQLARKTEHLKLFVEKTPAAIAMVDRNMIYLMYSKRWLEDFQLGDVDLTGKNIYEVFPEMPDRWKEIHERCLKGATEKCEEERFEFDNGNVVYLKWEVSPWYASGEDVTGLMIFTQDITAQVKARERIEMQKEELARSNADLEQFAYVASHDLKEPLRMVGNFVQLLEVRYKDLVDETGRKYIRYAVDGVTRMQNLINDLLTYSRIGRKEEQFSEIDPRMIIEEALKDLSQPIHDKGVRINIQELPPKVHCIESQLRLVMRNLIANGIKFNENHQPEITIRGEEDNQYWYLSVEDNGIGIEEKYKDQIFTIFQRLHSQQDYPGTGIGLAICKKVIEQHGGKIDLRKVNEHGTLFKFSLHKTPDNE